MSRAPGADCWNTIGVRGDRSCPELRVHGHCRNCPVFSAAATTLLERAPAARDVAEATAHFAEIRPARERDTRAVVLFRLDTEWLGLPGSVVEEVTPLLPVHSIPHRHGGVVMGLANVRGELRACISLGQLLGLAQSPASTPIVGRAARRLLAIRRDGVRVVCPIDEVHGVHRFHPRELQDVPATVGQAASAYSKAVLAWRGHAVGMLDDQLLFYSLRRSLA
jgi:chemotaxis-related protein WspD